MSRPLPPPGWEWRMLAGDPAAAHLVRPDASNPQRLQVACRPPATRVRAWTARDDHAALITCRQCERYAARYREAQRHESGA